MTVDKFGTEGDRATAIYTRLNVENLSNSFLRRDGGNTASGAIYKNIHIRKCGGSVVNQAVE